MTTEHPQTTSDGTVIDPDAGSFTDSHDRRRFLKRAAIAGAATWVAPTVLSSSAYAQGSLPCSPQTFLWSAGGNNTLHTATTNPVVGTIAGVADIRIVSTAFFGVPNSGLNFDNWMTRSAATGSLNCGSAATTNYPRGAQTSFYSLLMHSLASGTDCTNAGTANRYVEVEFGFYAPSTLTPLPVYDLAFTMSDIDSSTGNYRDRVEVAINGNPITTLVTLGATSEAVATRVGGTPTMGAPGATARIDALTNSSADASSTNGNLLLQFNTGVAVSSVRIRFTDIRGAAPATVQWVGIGDLSFCV